MAPTPAMHRIETLQWELCFAHVRQAEAHQDELARLLRERLLSRLEHGFERHAPATSVWQLDRLEVDLGHLQLSDAPQHWEQRLDEALERALLEASRRRPQADAAGAAARVAALDSSAGQRLSPRRHELGLFLHYLQHGHLPWGASAYAGRELALWLAQLAQRQGQALWHALQQLVPPGRALARLCRIAPHQGLQALLAVRDPDTAEAMLQVDRIWLEPLQAQGRLSAYQVQQLQQALRAAALQSLWGLGRGHAGPARRRRMIEQVLTSHSRLMGAGWTGLRRGLAADAIRPQHHENPLASQLLEALLGPTLDGRSAAGVAMLTPDTPGRTWAAGLAQLRRGLARDQASPAQRLRLAQLIRALAATHPALLREQLQRWLRERRSRRQCSELLDPQTLSLILGLLDGRGAAEGRPSAAPHWADSLRQTALRMQAECPAAHRPGLSRLQALLMEASLAHLAAGHRMPDNHRAWQALWQAAWQRWLADDAAPAPRSAPTAPAAPPPLPRGPLPPARLERELQRLGRDCEQQRWGLQQRLQLAQLLETPRACARWLSLFDEDSRWRQLRAQFGRAVDALRQRMRRLLGLSQQTGAPATRPWQALCRLLFIEAKGSDPARLKAALRALPPDGDGSAAGPVVPAPAGKPEASDAPLWVADAGQVLLAAFAERLFGQLGLLQQGRFADEAARARAVLCLQALVQGRTATAEPAWPLSKLLCGLEPGALLAEAAPLDDETHEMLEGLLGAVITHWTALGSTSVAGLRESFLRREGRLSCRSRDAGEAQQWLLQVQPRAFDMLLDRLPWGFTTIKLPWMNGVLHVEWR